MYVYIVWGTVLVAHNLKHSTLKRCTNIYCVIDFAAKPPADLAHNFRLLSSCGSHLTPLPILHSPQSLFLFLCLACLLVCLFTQRICYVCLSVCVFVCVSVPGTQILNFTQQG